MHAAKRAKLAAEEVLLRDDPRWGIGQSILMLGQSKQYPIHYFFVRKEAKKHGARELIDGYPMDDSEVLIVDDVATKGGSIKTAIENLIQEHQNFCPGMKTIHQCAVVRSRC